MKEASGKFNHLTLDNLHSTSPRNEHESRSNNISKISAPMPLLKTSQHSLQPDMYFGWRPKKGRILYNDKDGKKKKRKKYSSKYTIADLKHSQKFSKDNCLKTKVSRKLVKLNTNSHTQSNAERSTSSSRNARYSQKYTKGSRPSIKNIREAYFGNSKYTNNFSHQNDACSSQNSDRSLISSEVKQININNLSEIIDHLHMQVDREAYQIMKSNSQNVFKATDIFYKMPYLDAIKEYSENWK